MLCSGREVEQGGAMTMLPRSVAPLALALAAALLVGGCDPRDCALGTAHRDCHPEGSPLAMFPQDDAICQSYGLNPGTRDYAICRGHKRHERALTERATDYGALEEPLTLDVRPVYQVR